MFCTRCGKQLSNDTKFCLYCGNPTGVQNPAVPPQQRTVPQNQWQYQPLGQPQQQYQQFGQPQYIPQQTPPAYPQTAAFQKKKDSIALKAVMIAFLILGFTTIWMNWLTISTKIKDENIREAVKKYSGKTSTSSEMDFTDIFDADDEHELVTGNSINDYSNVSASDTILYAFHTMQYAGIIGYIFICLASVLLFVNRKYGAMLALLASIAFLTALIGDVVWCYKQTDNIDDLLGTMGISAKNIGVDYSIHIGIGAVIALVSSIAATIAGLLPGSSKKRAY